MTKLKIFTLWLISLLPLVPLGILLLNPPQHILEREIIGKNMTVNNVETLNEILDELDSVAEQITLNEKYNTDLPTALYEEFEGGEDISVVYQRGKEDGQAELAREMLEKLNALKAEVKSTLTQLYLSYKD